MTVDAILFEKRSSNFEATFTIADKKHSMTLCDFSENQKVEATILANNIIKWLDINLDKSKLFAAKELLELKNDAWLEEDEAPINDIKFADIIKLSGVIVFSNGSFEIYFDDNDIFWGHLIRVDIGENYEFENADIVG